jgi:hypothetical protein
LTFRQCGAGRVSTNNNDERKSGVTFGDPTSMCVHIPFRICSRNPDGSMKVQVESIVERKKTFDAERTLGFHEVG